MQKLRSCLAIGTVLCLSSAAHAVTLNFNNTAAYPLHESEFYGFFPTPYVESGFAVTNNCSYITNCLYFWGASAGSLNANPNGNTLNINVSFSTTTVRRADGGVFDLASIDIADSSNDGGIYQGQNATLRFTFTAASGATSSQNITLDANPGLQTLRFNATGLTSFSWVNTNNGSLGASQVDNIVLTPVPEPGTWALMLGGVAALGAAARRRTSA